MYWVKNSWRTRRWKYNNNGGLQPVSVCQTRKYAYNNMLTIHSCNYQKHQYAASDVLTIVGEDYRISTRQIKSIVKRAHLLWRTYANNEYLNRCLINRESWITKHQSLYWKTCQGTKEWHISQIDGYLKMLLKWQKNKFQQYCEVSLKLSSKNSDLPTWVKLA